MAALFDNFFQLASVWDLSSPEKQSLIDELKRRHGKKGAANVEANMRKDHMKCRFLDAVYSLQRASVIKVTNNGKSFQKIITTWIYDDV